MVLAGPHSHNYMQPNLQPQQPVFSLKTVEYINTSNRLQVHYEEHE